MRISVVLSGLVGLAALSAAPVASAASSVESNAITIDARARTCAVIEKAEPGLEARSWTSYVTGLLDFDPFASALLIFLR